MPQQTIGYHTCLDQGGATFLKQYAPFLATKDPFLSSGYYFWEHSIADAHAWGQTARYPRGRYAICKCELTLHYLLDLDYLPDIEELRNLEQEMLDCGKIPVVLDIGPLIQWFRDLGDDEIFPYDSVRTRQEPPEHMRVVRQYVASQRSKLLTLNPQFIICTFSKSASVVRSCQVVYPEHYRR
jgi:hypothetical protein